MDTDADDDLSSNKDNQRYTPKYLKMPDHVFVRMLSKSVSNGEQIIQWLDAKQKIDFIRQMTVTCNYQDRMRNSIEFVEHTPSKRMSSKIDREWPTMSFIEKSKHYRNVSCN